MYHKIQSHRQQERVRHIEVLTDMLDTGTIRRSRRVKRVILFTGETGKAFTEFINDQISIKSEGSIERYRERINNLYQYLLSEGRSVSNIDTCLMIKYVAKLDRENNNPNRDNIVMSTRIFFRYLCKNEMLSDNRCEMWMSLLKLKYIRNKKIPSVYNTKEEVEAIINSIDRSHPQGKRDYAMILLAARYGLRASDIIGLRFNNIEWEQNRITLLQKKQESE